MSFNHFPEKRPASEEELEGILRRAYSLAKKEDYGSAVALCNWLIEEPSTRIAGLRKRAAVYELNNDINSAIEDLETVVSSGVDEPADMYSLGLLYLQISRDGDAEVLLSKAIKVSMHEEFEYYLSSCRLLRAEALLRIKRPKDALDELAQLPEGFSVYVYGRGLRVKETMTAEGQQML